MAWFCLRSQLKREHIAASCLRRELNLDVFLPRIRFKKATRRGSVWFDEALFPNYLFARFDLALELRRVHHARGVAHVLRFGHRFPTIPDEVIAELKKALGTDSTHVVSAVPGPGSEVQITGSALQGLRAVVTQVLPARERVRVLLDFMGRATSVELSLEDIVPAENARSGFYVDPTGSAS